MDEIKRRLYHSVDARLAAAPDSTAKAELVEELSDNLYCRYLDMTAGGMSSAEAFQQALDELGDTGELVDYLKGLAPDEPLPKLTLHPEQGMGNQLDGMLKDVESIVSGALNRARSAIQEVKETVQESGAFDWKSNDEDVSIHVKIDPDHQTAPQGGGTDSGTDGGAAPTDASAGSEADTRREGADGEDAQARGKSRGWEFSVGFDPDEGKFFAGGGPKETDEAYGFGYNKAKGGFYTQWGEETCRRPAWDPTPSDGPIPSDTLRGIAVLVDGDVTVRMTEEPDGDVVIGGDVEDLEVRRSDDGVLTIRQGKTASSSFFFLRGLSSASVELSLPLRRWDFLNISSASGDVNISGDAEVELVSVKSVGGDLTGRLARCRKLSFKSTSGDLDWDGDVDEAQAETISGDMNFATRQTPCSKLQCKTTSGDVDLRGDLGSVFVQTVSGDIMLDGRADSVQASSMSGEVELSGSIAAARCSSMSGDIRLESAALPQRMELISKSGDCEARIPDNGPFSVSFKTTSGSFHSDFFTGTMGSRNNHFSYQCQGEEGGPCYSFSSTSGNLYLEKY